MSRLRLAVRMWPSAEAAETEYLLSLLSEDARALVQRHTREDDRRRALAARLLERTAASAALRLPLTSVRLSRTRGGKPYVTNPVSKTHAPNWNFSVSHEGDYVILASEPVAICGCDVAAPQAVRRPTTQPLHTFFRGFHRQFTRQEWEMIRGAGGEAEQEMVFRKLWSLKEAFVKATGEGLGFDLGLLEFKITGSTATVSVRGEPADGWVFHLHELGQGHWASVARAPVAAVVDAWGGFKATFQKTAFAAGEWEEQLAALEPAFTLLSVGDLLSEEEKAGYEAAGGELL